MFSRKSASRAQTEARRPISIGLIMQLFEPDLLGRAVFKSEEDHVTGDPGAVFVVSGHVGQTVDIRPYVH